MESSHESAESMDKVATVASQTPNENEALGLARPVLFDPLCLIVDPSDQTA